MLRKQQGFLVITLAIIIVIVGFIGTTIAYMYRASGRSVGYNVQSNQALGLAEAGLSKGIFSFNTSPVYPCPITVTSTNPSCPLSESWSASTALGKGEFQYAFLTYTGTTWSASYAPAAPTTTTTTSIPSSASLQKVSVSSITNFAPSGQIMVSSNPTNYLNYTGTSTDSATCGGTPPCFTGAKYNGGTTIATSKTVTQNQTVLSAAVSASSSLQTIRIADITNLAPSGQVIIGTQTIRYKGLASDSTICGGSPPCLIGASYPSGTTLSVNSRVSQNQVVVKAQGGVPNLASPQGQRIVMAPLLINLTTNIATLGGWAEVVN